MYSLKEEDGFKGQTPNSSKRKKISFSKDKILKVLPYFLVLILTIAAVFLGYNYYNLKKGYDPQNAEFKEVTESIKSLINIKEDEEVRVAKITDIEKLREQNAAFYKEAKNGQYLVVLPESQRVLIYDKNLEKIVNFSSYNIQVEVIPESDIDAAEKPLNIEIRTAKGGESGIDKEIAAQLKAISANYTTVKYSTTEKEYQGITLILLNSTSKPKMSQNIVAHVGTNSIAEKMPEGETSSTADVVLIIGSDVKKIN